MKKKTIVILLTAMIFSLLSGCAEGSAAGPAESGAQEETLSTAAAGPEDTADQPDETDKDYTAGTPWLCSMIEGTITEDTPTDPKDDFYLYANKEKLLSCELTRSMTIFGKCSPKVIRRAMTPGLFMICTTWPATGMRGMLSE